MALLFILLAMEVLKLALDATPSPNNELMWDTPAAASTWLKTFAINNEDLLKETNVGHRFDVLRGKSFSLDLVSDQIYVHLECS
jgi:hypothetical protein